MRKNIKKIVSLILVLIIIVTIAACGNQKKSKTSKKEKNKQENIEKKASNEYLPSRIENINNGGEIPEGMKRANKWSLLIIQKKACGELGFQKIVLI